MSRALIGWNPPVYPQEVLTSLLRCGADQKEGKLRLKSHYQTSKNGVRYFITLRKQNDTFPPEMVENDPVGNFQI